MGLIVPRDVTCAIFRSERESDFVALIFLSPADYLTESLVAVPLLSSRGFSLSLPSIMAFLANSRPRIILSFYRSCRSLASSFSVIVATRRGKNPPRPNDDVTLVHDSPRRITSGFLFPFVQNEKQDDEGRGERRVAARGGWRGGGRARTVEARIENGQCEQPSLTELLPLRSLHSREAVVYAPRHPTDAELMILINVS